MNLFKRRQRELDPDDENSIEGDRDLATVNKGVRLQSKLTNWAIIGGGTLLTVLLVFKYYAGVIEERRQDATPPKDHTRTVSLDLPPLPKPPEEPAAPPAAAQTMPPMAPPAASPVAQGAAPGQPPAKTQAELDLERRLKSGLRFNLETAQGSSPVADAFALASPGAVATSAAALGSPNAAPQPGAFKASRAYLLPDPTMIAPKGKVIPCTVVPAMDTTLSGAVTCMVAEEVRGADNKVPLIDPGTQCFGEQGGGVARGQARVGIIWSRCIGPAPGHVIVDLDSAAADSLGRIGIPGKVDNHFWDRFGAAIALSLISNVGPYLAATQQGGGNNNTTIAFPNLSGPQEVMTEVLKSTINIPSTITAPQGAQVLIYLKQDLDFRDVYALERVK
jgi:type IV secretion system protein VirB10